MKKYVHMTDNEFYALSNEELIVIWQDSHNAMLTTVDLFQTIGLEQDEIDSMTHELMDFYKWKNDKRYAEKYYPYTEDMDEDIFHEIVHEYAQNCYLCYRAYDALYRNNTKFYISRIRAFASKNGKTPSSDYIQEMLSEIAVNLPSFFPHYDRSKGLKYCTFIGKYLVQPLRNVLRGYATCPLSIYTENLLFKVNRVIDEFEHKGIPYDTYMLANRLNIGFKAVTEILNIRSRFDSSLSIDEMHENGTYLPLASSFDVEEEVNKKDMRMLVNRAAQECARKCGEPALTADIYISLITQTMKITDVQRRYPHMVRSYILQKIDEFTEYFRKSKEVSELEIAGYRQRANSIEALEAAIQSNFIVEKLAVSAESATEYLDEIVDSIETESGSDAGLHFVETIDLSDAI